MADFDLFNEMDSQRAWSKARRGVILQNVLCAIQDCSPDLIPFDQARQLLHLNQKICRGLQEIELDHIRGSVGRYHDFSSAFFPRRDSLSQRWQRVRSASTSKGLPPIELYKVGQAYFVVDGNHRVSVARTEGKKTINAYVCEYLSPLELSSEADIDEVLCKAEYAEFLHRTHLPLEYGIMFTIPGRYMQIECQIQSLQRSLEDERGEQVSFHEAAEIWYREIYTPTVREIKKNKVIERFPKRTESDLFIWMWQREPELQAYCTQSSSSEIEDSPFDLLRRSIHRLSAVLRRIFL